jgi:RimJ/RimL family protein N-acetyltransferase
MLESERLVLRAAGPDDAPAIHALQSDPQGHLIANGAPYVPQTVESVRRRYDRYQDDGPDARDIRMVLQSRADGEFLGIGSLWGIDQFNGYGHLGLGLVAAARGQGLGVEALGLLCRFGFWLRNLRRLELETLASNEPMRRTAQRCGFTHEGIQRAREYDGTGYVDIALYGLLQTEWVQRT